MGLSIIEPLNQAMDRTIRMLFQPFDIKKWLVLGFCAWLASLDAGGGMPGFFGNWSRGSGRDLNTQFFQLKDWFLEHLLFILVLGGGLLLLGFLINILVLWISSRGKFMFLDGVVQNRAEVRQPWTAYQRQGNSLFWFFFALGLILSVLILMILFVCGVVAWADLRVEQFGPGLMAALLLGLLTLGPLTVLYVLVRSLTVNFVVPLMYIRQIGVLEAWAAVRQEILTPYLGSVILFYLMRILIALVFTIASTLVACVTCCVATLPYIGTVILLPLPVFSRCFSLYFIEQIGPQMKVFPLPEDFDDLLPRQPK